jgi:hypothetical protein
VITLTGATVVAFIGLILPSAIHLKLFGAEGAVGKLSLAMGVLGVLMFVAVPVLTFV